MRKFWGILVLLAAIRLVLMAVTPVFDPSESRYAVMAANMARSGDFTIPHFTYKGVYQSYDGKPPLVFQAGGLFCKVFGITEFSVRIFPFLSAVLLLVILYRTLCRLANRETAELGVGILATSAAFYAAAGFSMPDMTLACCVAGALLVYARGWRDSACAKTAEDKLANLEIAALLGLGMLAKGPIALVMFGLPVVADAAVNHRWRAVFNRKWLWAMPIFLLIAVPWFVLVERRNPGSVGYFFYHENFLRFFTSAYGDRYGAGREFFRGAALLWALAVCLPWTLFIPRTKLVWKDFFGLSALTLTLFWCLTSRALIYYLLPVIPLFAAYLARHGNAARLRRAMPTCAFLTVLFLASALAYGIIFTDKMQGAKTKFTRHGSSYAYEFYHGQLEKPRSE